MSQTASDYLTSTISVDTGVKPQFPIEKKTLHIRHGYPRTPPTRPAHLWCGSIVNLRETFHHKFIVITPLVRTRRPHRLFGE